MKQKKYCDFDKKICYEMMTGEPILNLTRKQNMQTGKFGVVLTDDNGNIVKTIIPFMFDGISDFCNGIAIAKKIDYSGVSRFAYYDVTGHSFGMGTDKYGNVVCKLKDASLFIIPTRDGDYAATIEDFKGNQRNIYLSDLYDKDGNWKGFEFTSPKQR